MKFLKMNLFNSNYHYLYERLLGLLKKLDGFGNQDSLHIWNRKNGLHPKRFQHKNLYHNANFHAFAFIFRRTLNSSMHV